MDLFDRVKDGDLDYIKTVAADVLLDARDEKGRTVLSAATEEGKLDCCKEILKKCPSLLYIQEESTYTYTVLHGAISNGNYMLVDYFLGVGLDAATNEGNMVRFMKWIKLKNGDAATNEGREENMVRFIKWIKLKNHMGYTALTMATDKKNLHAVKRLIEVDREYKLGLLEIVNDNNQTALQLAVKNQDHEIIKLLTGEGDPYSDYIPYSIAMDMFDHVNNGDLDYVKTVRSDVLLKSRDIYRSSALSIAAISNQLGCCEEILKRCPILLYHQNKFEQTVLHHATYLGNGYYSLVDLFVGVALDAATIEGNVESKAENMQRFKNWINLQDHNNKTALALAVYYRNHDTVKRFLEVDRQYKLGLSEIAGFDKKTPLQLALDNEDQEMIKLLTEGTDPDFEPNTTMEGRQHRSKAIYDIDLIDRVKKGDIDYIKTVTADILFNARDEEGNSVISAAIEENKIGCCKEILKKCPSLLYFQADIFFKNTVLHDAMDRNNYIFLDYLLSAGLDAATNEEGSFMKWIKLKNSREENMLRFKKWIKLKNFESDTALTMAASKKNLHAVKRLIEIDREYKLGLSGTVGPHSQTALQLAVKNQDHEMIKLLTDEGDPYSDYIPYSIAMDLFDHVNKGDLDYVKTVRSDVLLNSRDKFRESALCIATRCNQFSCCEEILKRFPILLYHQNRFEQTVLHHATGKVSSYRLVDLFVGVGLDAATIEGNAEIKAENMQCFKNWINFQNHINDTALHLAVKNRNHDIVKIFLQVDRQYKLGLSEIICSAGKTAFQLALEYEDQEMIKLLTEGTDLDLEHSAANTDGNMSLLIATSHAKEALHTRNKSDSADPDFEYGANIDGNISLSIATTQAQEALHTGNNSDSARKDVIKDFEKVHHTSLAMDRMEDFYVGEFDKNSSTDSTTRLLYNLASEKPRPYSHAQLMKFTKGFSDPVGSGGFGDVYKGEFPNGVLIAVKILKNSRPELMKKQFEAEVSTMGRTYHRNLIKLYGYCYEADTKALIYEYMERGDLDVILKKNNLDMVKLYTIATEIARGISYLHESCDPQIIHHDLKPANVLLDSKFSPRVIDFGLARLNMDKSQIAQSRLRGTYGYVAPEIALQGPGTISCKCDVYSFGMMLFDILKSKINYVDQKWLPGQVWVKVKEDQLDNFLKDRVIKEDDNTHAKTLSMVALLCAEYKPQNRPSMSTVVKMLEGGMTPNHPIDPFPLYDSSSDSSTTHDLSY